jgi:hypothetical protein
VNPDQPSLLARPGSLTPIPGGALVAIGATRWLVQDCSEPGRCSDLVVDRATGARHTVPGEAIGTTTSAAGRISPDGRFAAVPVGQGLVLLDLATGDQLPLAAAADPSPDVTRTGEALVWSPDSRWLFLPDADRGLVAVDRSTGVVHDLGARLPRLFQLAAVTTR